MFRLERASVPRIHQHSIRHYDSILLTDPYLLSTRLNFDLPALPEASASVPIPFSVSLSSRQGKYRSIWNGVQEVTGQKGNLGEQNNQGLTPIPHYGTNQYHNTHRRLLALGLDPSRGISQESLNITDETVGCRADRQ